MRQVSRFAIGDVLQKSLSIYLRNLPAVAVLAVVLAVVWEILLVAYGAGGVPLRPVIGFAYDFGVFFVVVLLGICWFEGGMTFIVERALRARSPTWREVLTHTLQAVPRMLVVAAIVGLGPVAILALVVFSFDVLAPLAGLMKGLVMAVLLAAIVIPTLVSWVAVPVASVEGGGVRRALRRSHELTSGHKGRIFAIRLLIYFCHVGTVWVPLPILWWASGVIAGVGLSVQSAVVAVCYHDLRMLKDGADDTGRLADVSA